MDMLHECAAHMLGGCCLPAGCLAPVLMLSAAMAIDPILQGAPALARAAGWQRLSDAARHSVATTWADVLGISAKSSALPSHTLRRLAVLGKRRLVNHLALDCLPAAAALPPMLCWRQSSRGSTRPPPWAPSQPSLPRAWPWACCHGAGCASWRSSTWPASSGPAWA